MPDNVVDSATQSATHPATEPTIEPAIEIHIRPAELSESDRLREIFTAAKSHWGYDRDRVAELAGDLDLSAEALREKEVFVAEVSGHDGLAGFATLIPRGEIAILDDLWIDPEFMGRGIGSALFHHLADRARGLGARRLEWETEPNAVGFYEAMGAVYVRDSEPTAWGRILPIMGIDLHEEGRTRRAVRRTAARAGSVLESVADAGGALLERIEPVIDSVGPALRAAGRLRSPSNEPLPNLYDVHPEARMAPVRELGVYPIPVEEIRGTAVEGPAQRGRDFLPLPPFRSRNWEARWQRIRNAVDRLANLPPIEVLKAGDGYWVLDGHNRVAAALRANQVDIDAVVKAVQLPGQPPELPKGPLAPVLAESDQVWAAGRGMLTPGSTLGPYDHPLHAAPVADERPE
jgi:GNAT superfamily N-acetyltransferase